MALIERECWPQVEARRVEEGLHHARFWQRTAPHKMVFWEVFDETILAQYPECRFKVDDQLTLGKFSAAAE
ncbi:hypothetical protein [Haloarcula laminariae]|uniref:hypothetical protein n=1 Tax=Haloarcula laminariae TaxID=2961577 RepID=UPI0021C73216|nr:MULTISPECIES: hypothetical protein [Halomicroarcula]